MTRRKVKLAYITNDSARKATYKKRKKGLLKKVHELSTLCGIEACAIIYGPDDTQPEVWPSPVGVQRVLTKFERMPEMEQNKKMNQESFLKQRVEKLKEQLKKQLRENREKEITRVMLHSLTGRGPDFGLNLVDLNDLGWVIDQHKKEIQQKLDRINNVPLGYSTMPLSVVPADAAPEGRQIVPAQEAPSTYDVNMEVQRAPWLMNLHEQIGFAGEEPMLPFGDNSFNPFWSNGPFR